MKELVLTTFNDKMKPIGDLTSPLILSYASKHGMDFKCVRIYPENEPPYIHTLIIKDALESGYDRIIFIEADIIITNPEYVPPWVSGFHVSRDWGLDATESNSFSLCCFAASQNSKSIFDEAVKNRHEDLYGSFPEQDTMRKLYYTNQHLITVHPRRVFNSVPRQVHPTVQEPWKKGDWICHLTMLPIQDRVKLFHQIVKEM